MSRTRIAVFPLGLALLLSSQARASVIDELVAVKAVTASSVLPGKEDRYAPVRAIDDNVDTAWCEGVPDEGVGQSWTLTFETPTVIDEIELQPGMRKSDKLFKSNNLPVKLEVQVDGAKPVVLTSTNWTRPKAKLPGTPTTRLTVKFVEVEKRTMNDTCLTQVSLRRGGSSLMLMTGIPRAAFPVLPAAVRELSSALKACDPAVLARRVRFPLQYEQGQEGETPSLKYRFADVAALVKGCKKEQAPGGAKADEIIEQKKGLDEIMSGRRAGTNEVVVDPFMGWDIGQQWHLGWTEGAGWQLTAVDL